MAEVDMQGNGKRRFQDDARETRAHAQAFASSLGNTMKDVDGAVRTMAERNPYAALGAALGMGFILGGGIPPALSMVVAGETAKEVKNEEGR
jgi:hypothetical protein